MTDVPVRVSVKSVCDVVVDDEKVLELGREQMYL
jgi:hypothetical protein